MTMVDLVAIDVETLSIDSGCSLKKEFTKLIRMNPQMILYLTFNHVNLYHGYVCGPLTWDAKYSLWVEICVLIMTYLSLVTRYLKFHILYTT